MPGDGDENMRTDQRSISTAYCGDRTRSKKSQTIQCTAPTLSCRNANISCWDGTPPSLTCAAESCLHLIGDQQCVVCMQQLLGLR
jgi:hypothetical protein